MTIIDLWPIVADCVVCGDPSYKSGIPTYEGLVLPNDWDGEWGGQPACDSCRELQGSLTQPVELSEFRRIAKAARGAKEDEQ